MWCWRWCAFSFVLLIFYRQLSGIFGKIIKFFVVHLPSLSLYTDRRVASQFTVYTIKELLPLRRAEYNGKRTSEMHTMRPVALAKQSGQWHWKLQGNIYTRDKSCRRRRSNIGNGHSLTEWMFWPTLRMMSIALSLLPLASGLPRKEKQV